MNRKEILEDAIHLIYQDRQAEYGTPQDNFKRIASLWSVVV